MKSILSFLVMLIYSYSASALPDSGAVQQIKNAGLSPYLCEVAGYLTTDPTKLRLRVAQQHVQATDISEARKFCLLKLDASLGFGPERNELFVNVPTLSKEHRLVVETFEIKRLTFLD